jgi:hypothetical protein
MEAVELMTTTYQLGDRVLMFAHSAKISAAQAEALLRDLAACFTSPLENRSRIVAIAKQLGEHEK